MRIFPVVYWLFLGIFLGWATAALASELKPEEEDVQPREFDIPAMDAPKALADFAEIVESELIYLLEQVEGVRLNAVRGTYTPREAIQRMVDGTAVTVVRDPASGAWIVKSREQSGAKRTAHPQTETTNNKRQKQMMKPKTLRQTVAGLLSLFLLGGSPEALAQAESEQERDEIKELDEFEVAAEAYEGYISSVTVSGARTQMNLVNVPQTINIITGDVIEDMGSTDPQDAITKASPGTSSFGPPTGPNIMIRGFRAQNWAVDGATSRYRIGLTNFNWDAIEVIKGPSSLLYGPFGAYGGYVNLVAKKPSPTPKNKVQLGIGTDSYIRGMADLGQVWGEDGDWQTRFVAGILGEDFAGPHYGNREGWIIAPSVAVNLNDNARLTLRYSYEHMEQTAVVTAQNATGELEPGFNQRRNKNDVPSRSADSQMYQLTYTNRLSDNWSVRANLYGQFEEYDYNLALLLGSGPADVYPFRLDERNADQWTVYGDIAFTWLMDKLPNGITNQFTFGTEINHWDLTRGYWALSNQYPAYSGFMYDITDPNQYTQIPGPDDLDYPNRNLPYNKEWLGAAFFQDNLTLMDGKLTFSYGGRWNYDARSNFRQVRVPNTPDGELVARPGSPEPTNVNQKWTWRYGAIYKPFENMTVYFGHTEAYLPVGAIFKADGSPLEPETGANDEIGFKFDLVEALGGQWSGSIAFFQLEVENKWRGDPNNPGFFIQDGLQTNDGMEASVTYSNDRLTLIGGYYRSDGPIEPNNNNVRAVYSPDRTFNFWGKYQLTDQFAFGGGFRGVGDTLSNDRQITISAYESVDLFATYTVPFRDGKLKLHAVASNLADENNVFRINNARSIFISEGLRMKLTATYTW